MLIAEKSLLRMINNVKHSFALGTNIAYPFTDLLARMYLIGFFQKHNRV